MTRPREAEELSYLGTLGRDDCCRCCGHLLILHKDEECLVCWDHLDEEPDCSLQFRSRPEETQVQGDESQGATEPPVKQCFQCQEVKPCPFSHGDPETPETQVFLCQECANP